MSDSDLVLLYLGKIVVVTICILIFYALVVAWYYNRPFDEE